ncbi:MAG: 50S ribosomal protein L17 [Fusobacteria bacterium]|nr:50S ribosomal protein L17 [Fusobacteriota bacterium]
MGYRRLGVRSSHRKAMLRNMTTSLLASGKIETTETRATEVKRIAEKMITLGKRGKSDLHAVRQAMGYLTSEDVVIKKVFGEYAERYANRQGGYTRIIKTGYRRGDASPMAIIELVE